MADLMNWLPAYLQYQQDQDKPVGLLDQAKSPLMDKGLLTAMLIGNVGAGIMAGNKPGARFGDAVGHGLQTGMASYGLLMPQMLKQQKEEKQQDLVKALITETDPAKQKQIAGLLSPEAAAKSMWGKENTGPKVVPSNAAIWENGVEKYRNPGKPEAPKWVLTQGPNGPVYTQAGEGTPGYVKPDKPEKPTLLTDEQGNLVPWTSGQSLTGLKKSDVSGELDLTPEAIKQMARRYLLDGTMPGLGLGKAATKARSLVMNEVPKIMTEEGLSPQGAVANKQVIGALKSSLSRLEGQRAPMLAFAETADKNLDVALNLSQQVGRTGVPVLNRWVLAGRKQVAGDPDVAAFDAAVRTSINEYAKVTSSATGGGVTSDQARKEVETMLTSAQTPEQFNKVVQTLRLDMQNRIRGYDSQREQIQKALQGVGTGRGGGMNLNKITGPEQLPLGKAMKVNGQIVGKFADGLYLIDAQGQKLGRYGQ